MDWGDVLFLGRAHMSAGAFKTYEMNLNLNSNCKEHTLLWLAALRRTHNTVPLANSKLYASLAF